MGGIPLSTAAMFVFVVVTQVLVIAFIPRTAGFTDPFWTAALLGTYMASMWCLSYMIHNGLPISLLIPILSAVVPLVTIFIGVFIYKEAASLMKIATFCLACGLIGFASTMK